MKGEGLGVRTWVRKENSVFEEGEFYTDGATYGLLDHVRSRTHESEGEGVKHILFHETKCKASHIKEKRQFKLTC